MTDVLRWCLLRKHGKYHRLTMEGQYLVHTRCGLWMHARILHVHAPVPPSTEDRCGNCERMWL